MLSSFVTTIQHTVQSRSSMAAEQSCTTRTPPPPYADAQRTATQPHSHSWCCAPYRHSALIVRQPAGTRQSACSSSHAHDQPAATRPPHPTPHISSMIAKPPPASHEPREQQARRTAKAARLYCYHCCHTGVVKQCVVLQWYLTPSSLFFLSRSKLYAWGTHECFLHSKYFEWRNFSSFIFLVKKWSHTNWLFNTDLFPAFFSKWPYFSEPLVSQNELFNLSHNMLKI